VAATVSVLFVCLGNICRSPMAEGIFRELLAEAGLDGRVRVDSAGTDAWHVGEPPDARARAVAARRGVTLEGRARQVTAEDLRTFDHVVAMDTANLLELEALRHRSGGTATLHLLRDFDPEAGEDRDVPDPYYGGPRGLDDVFDMIHRSARELLHLLRAELDDAAGGT